MKLQGYNSARSPVYARNIVSTSQPLAAQAGLSMLKQGGNAVDAALATAICLTVVEPTGNGLGSDAFAIIWDGKQLHGLNSSGRAPKAWTPEFFKDHKEMPKNGWGSVTVPGAVSAWVSVSERFGKLPFAKLFEPAIKYAEEGFIVSPIIANLWQKGAAKLHNQPGFAEAFMPNGRAPKAGELFRNPAQARSLRLIAETKGEAFYKGELAEKMIAHANANGSVMSLDDLAEHKNDWVGTISMDYHDVSLYEIPPNGQGIAALIALGILENFPLKDYAVDSVESIHLQIEAVKLAYADLHAFVADGDYMSDVTAKHLLDKNYLKSRAQLIDMNKAQDFKCGAPKHGGTVYLSACDENDMMVSFIQSNYEGFGSGVVVPETGISLQNRGMGFTLEAGHPNQVGPSKRPFHTIIPGFLMQDANTPLMSFGVMGGPMQAQAHMQMVVRTQTFGQNPQQASDAPRWRFIEGNHTVVEESFDKTLRQALIDKGHQIVIEDPDSAFSFGGAQLVKRIDKGCYVAGSDHRKDGQAVGF